MHTPGHTSSHPPEHKDARNAHEKSCVRTGQSCAAHAAHTKPPCMVRGLHTARRDVALRSTRSGCRKPVASATLGGGRPMRRASLPAGPAAGSRPSLGVPDERPFSPRSGQRASGIAVGETSNTKLRFTCGARPYMHRRVSASVRQVTTFVPRSTLQRGRSTTREGRAASSITEDRTAPPVKQAGRSHLTTRSEPLPKGRRPSSIRVARPRRSHRPVRLHGGTARKST